MNLTLLNNLPKDKASEVFESCCVAPRWVKNIVEGRPYTSKEHLYETAQTLWNDLGEPDFLAAFEGHPQIGDVSTLRAKFSATAEKAGNEQSGMSIANEAIINEMMAVNKAYLTKFGFIFIVCATGKTAEQMLTIIKDRMSNDRATELFIAANEQAKITKIRLEKLL